ncbi:MAG: glycosyltransferase family 4 protein [Anaerolineae bacterium]
MPKKLKVAYLLTRFPYLTETFILREMLELRNLGVDVRVFSVLPPLPTPVHRQVQEMMPYVHYSPYLLSVRLILAQLHFLLRSPLVYLGALVRAVWQTVSEPSVMFRVLMIFSKSVFFAKQMQDLEIDHIHAHFVWINGIAAQIASDLTGITFSLHPHAFGLFMRDQKSVRRQLELADGIVTVSEYHRQYIAKLCPRWSPEDVRIVHYGLDTREFTPAHVPAQDGTVRIISVGSLIEKKGHEYLVDACARLAEKGYSFHCTIVGHGQLRSQLEGQISRQGLQDHVSLVGARTQEEVKDLYRHSDIFVLACVVAKSGDVDGMPNVLLEAMAMQLPVVTTPVTGIPELVHHEETGLLVPERDADALAAAIERLINDETLRHRLGQQGRQAVLSGFDIRHSAAQLATAFQEFRAAGSGSDAAIEPLATVMLEN